VAKLEITGAKKLYGKIKIAGNKNAVLPIMAACLLTDEVCIIDNVPEISDVLVMTQLLSRCGVKIQKTQKKLKISAKNFKNKVLPKELTEKLRASILLLGPLLTKGAEVKMGYPGGDIIGRRSLDVHIQVVKALGAKILEEEDFLTAKVNKLQGADIFLEEASVTATENAIMAAVLAEGETVIRRAASEPHVVDLCNFLIKMGAKITGIGTNRLEITGVNKLFGATHSVRPDHIEVGTFATLAAVTSSKIEISPVVAEDMDMILLTLSRFGIKFRFNDDTLIILGGKLEAVEKVVVDVWPGFPTDLMAPMIVLSTQAQGVTILHDWMYESRMFFVDKILSMGAKVEIADPHRVFVYGPTKLRGQRLDTPDIRAGMALVIAACAAQEKSIIGNAELIERGYENIVERLSALGADIKRID